MKKLNPIKQEEILDLTYVCTNDIYNLLPMGLTEARKLFLTIKNELLGEGLMLMPSRPEVIPLERVLEKWPIDQLKIRRAATRMKKEAAETASSGSN